MEHSNKQIKATEKVPEKRKRIVATHRNARLRPNTVIACRRTKECDMIDRRHFVRISAGATLGGILGLDHSSLARIAEATGDRSLDRIGVQLYTVRTLMEKDFNGTLGAIADIGFHDVEFFDYFGREPQQVRDVLDRLGLETPAAHFSWQAFNENPDAVIETALAVGHRYGMPKIIVPCAVRGNVT